MAELRYLFGWLWFMGVRTAYDHPGAFAFVSGATSMLLSILPEWLDLNTAATILSLLGGVVSLFGGVFGLLRGATLWWRDVGSLWWFRVKKRFSR